MVIKKNKHFATVRQSLFMKHKETVYENKVR